MQNKSLAIGVLIGCVAVIGLTACEKLEEGPLGIHVGDTIRGKATGGWATVTAVDDEWIEIRGKLGESRRFGAVRVAEVRTDVLCPHD